LSISTLVSEYAEQDIVIWGSLELGPPPYPDLDELWRRSPIRYVQNIKTPLLLTCGEMDLRCAISQSEEMFGAMRLLGKTVELVRFPEESHDISRGGRPDRRVERLRRIAGWVERFLGTATSEHRAEAEPEVDTQVLATRSLAANDEETVEAWAVAPDVAEPVRTVEAELDPEAVVLAPEVDTYDLAPVIAPAADAQPEAEAAATASQEPAVEAQATQPPAA